MASARTRTRTALLGLALLSTLTLTGCFNYDAGPDTMQVFNSSDTTVVVSITGTEITEEVAPGGGGFPYGKKVKECVGDGIVVSDVDGNVIANFDGPACGYTTVGITKDGTVAVTDRDRGGPRTPEPLPTGIFAYRTD